MIYEVKKFGVTIEYTRKISEAESAFNQAYPGGVEFLKLDTGTQKKSLVKTR